MMTYVEQLSYQNPQMTEILTRQRIHIFSCKILIRKWTGNRLLSAFLHGRSIVLFTKNVKNITHSNWNNPVSHFISFSTKQIHS